MQFQTLYYFFTKRFHTHKKAPKSTKSIRSTKKSQKYNQAKTQNANKRISDIFSLRYFLHRFFLFLFAVNGFVLFCTSKIFFLKKKKKFETDLMTWFMLLLISYSQQKVVINPYCMSYSSLYQLFLLTSLFSY